MRLPEPARRRRLPAAPRLVRLHGTDPGGELELNPTRILGILNTTTDSFSDGGRFHELDAAFSHARSLMDDGAWGLDIGAVSSNPDSAGLSPAAEIARLAPLLDEFSDIPISIDTFSPEVQCWAAGRVAMLNDIRGFPDPATRDVLADHDTELVVMHSLADGPADREQRDIPDIVDHVLAFFDRRLEELTSAGIDEERLWVDPGMGFFVGPTPEPSIRLLRAIPRIRAHTGRPVYISVSRKSFLGALLGGRPPMERRHATLAAELYAVAAGAEAIRTHEPRPLVDALAIQATLQG